jgi:hypothetical protein
MNQNLEMMTMYTSDMAVTRISNWPRRVKDAANVAVGKTGYRWIHFP